MRNFFYNVLILSFFIHACQSSDSSQKKETPVKANLDSYTFNKGKIEFEENFELIESVGAPVKKTIGMLVSVEESGNGPFMLVNLEDKDGESIHFLLENERASTLPDKGMLSVEYVVRKDSLITGIRLKNESIEEAVALLTEEYGIKDAAFEQMENAAYQFDALHMSGDQGDLSKNVTLKLPTGEVRYFKADFNSEVDDNRRFAMKEVVVYGNYEEDIILKTIKW
ncbi:MAG: hypothetical protein CMO01_17885 [Thalassobius sp.]|nr:hypothetical protein [Thalassovita sp.]